VESLRIVLGRNSSAAAKAPTVRRTREPVGVSVGTTTAATRGGAGVLVVGAAQPKISVLVPREAGRARLDRSRSGAKDWGSLPGQCSVPSAPPNRRLELAGRRGRGSIERLLDREAAMERWIVLFQALRPQLKRGR
jgi:hypothetical protein